MTPRGIDTEIWRGHAWRNRLQSIVLLLTMGAVLGLLGWLLWGGDGVVILVTAGVFGVLFNPTLSPRLVMRLYGAVPIAPQQAPALWSALTELAARAGLAQTPELHYVPSRMFNAFAVGSRERAAIAVTDGLLRGLLLREVVAVLAHEISHIRNNDLWIMGLADTMTRSASIFSLIGQFLVVVNLPLMLFTESAISWLAILLLVFAPHLVALAQLALSRTREYDADLNAVRLTGDPEGLASALQKIERVQGGWMERILMPGRRVPDPSLLRTHPETEERVRRLLALRPRFPEIERLRLGGPDVIFGRPVSRRPRWHVNGLWY